MVQIGVSTHPVGHAVEDGEDATHVRDREHGVEQLALPAVVLADCGHYARADEEVSCPARIVLRPRPDISHKRGIHEGQRCFNIDVLILEEDVVQGCRVRDPQYASLHVS